MDLAVGNQTLTCDNGRTFRASNGEQFALTKESLNSYDSSLILYKVNSDGSLKPVKNKKYVNFPLMRSIQKDDFVTNIGTVRTYHALDTESKIAHSPCCILLHSGKHNNMFAYDDYNKAVKISGKWVSQDSDFMKAVKDSKFLNMHVTENLRSSEKAFEEFCAKFGKLGNEVYVRVMKQLLKSYLK